MSTNPTPEPRLHRARVAALTRYRDAGDPDLTEARRDLNAANAEQYLARLVAEWPPLTAEQRLRLAAILASNDREATVDG